MPVLPYLAEYFQTDPVNASRLITRVMLTLAFGSVLSGLFLRSLGDNNIVISAFYKSPPVVD